MAENKIEVSFPGNLKVAAEYKGHRVVTDQPVYAGGEGSAPGPFDLFLISIATCAGYYFLAFCQERKIPTAAARLTMSLEKNPATRMISRITIDLYLPPDFPEKYKAAVKRAIDTCTVKAHILNPPEFEIRLLA